MDSSNGALLFFLLLLYAPDTLLLLSISWRLQQLNNSFSFRTYIFADKDKEKNGIGILASQGKARRSGKRGWDKKEEREETKTEDRSDRRLSGPRREIRVARSEQQVDGAFTLGSPGEETNLPARLTRWLRVGLLPSKGRETLLLCYPRFPTPTTDSDSLRHCVRPFDSGLYYRSVGPLFLCLRMSIRI